MLNKNRKNTISANRIQKHKYEYDAVCFPLCSVLFPKHNIKQEGQDGHGSLT